MTKTKCLLKFLSFAISFLFFLNTPVFAQLLKYNNEAEVFGASAVSPESGRQVLQKLVNYCSSVIPESEIAGKTQLDAWVSRHQKYLDENVIIRSQYLALVRDSRVDAKVKEAIATSLNVGVPKMIDAQFESLASAIKYAPDLKSKKSLCDDYFQSIAAGKFDLKNNDPVVFEFLNKRIAQKTNLKNEVSSTSNSGGTANNKAQPDLVKRNCANVESSPGVQKELIGAWKHIELYRILGGQRLASQTFAGGGILRFYCDGTWDSNAPNLRSAGTFRWISEDTIETTIIDSNLAMQLGQVGTKRITVNNHTLEMRITQTAEERAKIMPPTSGTVRQDFDVIVVTRFERFVE